MQHRLPVETFDDTEPAELIIARLRDEVQELRAEIRRLRESANDAPLPFASQVYRDLVTVHSATDAAAIVDARYRVGHVRVRIQ